MGSIPRISFNDLKDNNALAISNLSDALNEHGFFSIYDHPVNKDLIKKCYDKSKDFFALSEDKKCAYAFPNIAGARGYTPFGKETALGEDVPDLKEFWHHGPVIDTSYDSRISENIIINEIEKFNSIFDDLFNALNSLGIDLNRDAVAQQAVETKLLMKAINNFKPDIAFNLHDQRTLFSVGKDINPATISFLIPSFNQEKTIIQMNTFFKTKAKFVTILTTFFNLRL